VYEVVGVVVVGEDGAVVGGVVVGDGLVVGDGFRAGATVVAGLGGTVVAVATVVSVVGFDGRVSRVVRSPHPLAAGAATCAHVEVGGATGATFFFLRAAGALVEVAGADVVE
jgi:hypothetical protein